MAGPPFHTAIGDFVAFACLYLQAAGGEQNGDETQRYEQEWNWFLQRHVVSVEKIER